MENSNVNRLSFGASLTAKLSSLIMLALQLYCGLIFYNGIAKGIGFANGVKFAEYGKELLNWMKSLTGKDPAILPGLLKLLHALVLVVAVLNFLISFIRFFGLFFGKKDKYVRNTKNSFVISKKFISSVSMMLLFMVAASWLRAYNLLATAYLLMAVAAAGIIVSCISRCVMAKTPFTTVVFQPVYCVIMFAIIGVLMMFCSRPVASEVKYCINLIKDLKGVPVKELLPVIFYMAYAVMCGFVALNVVAMVRSCRKCVTVPNKKIKRYGKFTLAYVILAIAFTVLSQKEFDKDLIEIYAVFLLAGLAAFFFGLINPRLEKKSDDDTDGGEVSPEDEENGDNPEQAPNEEAAPEQQPEALPEPTPAPLPEPMPEPEPAPAPVPKILFVGRRVKKIKSKKYRNRTDINVIVIPESVAYIEGYAFFGCTELTEIHCERKEKPRFWHNQWNFGCPAKVVWDSTNVDSEQFDTI